MEKIKTYVKKIWGAIPVSIQFIFKLYLSLMVLFFFARVAFIAVGLSQIGNSGFGDILATFNIGLTYDTASAGYLLILPWLISLIFEIVPVRSYKPKRIYLYFLTVYFLLAFFVLVADIPYYQYFNTRITNTALGFFESPEIAFNFVAESTQYYPYLIVIAAVTYGFFRVLRRYIRTWQRKQEAQIDPSGKPKFSRKRIAIFFIVLALFQFVGIRGKITTRRPLRWAEAFISTNPFLNYAGLNPLFTLGSSALSKTKNNPIDIVVYDPDKAIANVRKYFGISGNDFASPIARLCTFDSSSKYNVVVVLMESMTNAYLGRSGLYKPSLTPYIDSLIGQSLYFPNIYSDGIHTCNGVFSVFTSMLSPCSELNAYANMDNLMTFGGIGTVLNDNGYSTFFGVPHDANFDNMGGLLSMNGFEKIFSSKEFGNKEFVNAWGTSDHFLFSNCFADIKKMGRSGKPFLAAMMTISNHGPYVIPDNLPKSFAPHNTDKELRAVEYADWSLRFLIDNLRNEPWFDNTIFVFVADHGLNIGANYEVNYNYKSVPLFFYAPKIIKPGRNEALGCQADLFPTLMEFLGINYVNNTMGINLLREKRRFVPHARHSTVLATSDSFMLIRREDGTKLLYKYRNGQDFPTHFDMKDYSRERPELAKAMEEYVLSNIQTSITQVKTKKAKYIKK